VSYNEARRWCSVYIYSGYHARLLYTDPEVVCSNPIGDYRIIDFQNGCFLVNSALNKYILVNGKTGGDGEEMATVFAGPIGT